MLSLLDDEESLAEAIEISRGLGAEPLTRRVAGRMRELGLSVPHGPRRGDACESGRPDGSAARGPRAPGRGAHERGDRRPARRVAADRRAPRRRRADEARSDDAPGRGRGAPRSSGWSRPEPRSIVDPWSCSSATGRWLRSPRRATRRRGARVASSSSPASRGSARPRSSRGSCEDLEAGARVLFGTCDDLSIPRPLGPIRDLVGTVSAPLEEALAAGAASHEIQSLLIAELELPPRPTVLVLEDVHWADDATLDSITVLGRRIGSLPALLVLTFRGGEVPPAIRCAPPSARSAPTTRSSSSSRRCRRARSPRSPATTRTTCTRRPAATRSTSPSCSRPAPAAELPPSVANAVLGRASRLDDDARRLVRARLGRAEPRRARRCWTR